MKAVEAKVDEVGVVFDREEERKELAPITVISTISLEVNTLKNILRCHHHHLNVISTISLSRTCQSVILIISITLSGISFTSSKCVI